MERIDATGKPCPIPVVEAKRALKRPETGGVIVIVDNFTAVQNLEKMAAGLGYGFSYLVVSRAEYEVTLTKDDFAGVGRGDAGDRDGRPYKDVYGRDSEGGRGVVVAIGGDEMGVGAGELGRALMKSYIYSLTELEPPPMAVLFFNSGAKLTSPGANTLPDLNVLSGMGSRILTCGACIDYYRLAPPAVGEVTNMFEIAALMACASHVINL